VSRILIVDDEKLITLMFKEVLEAEGHEVVIAYDGEEGLRKQRKTPCDLVIADVVMPIMGGIEMITEMRRESGAARFLVVTSITDAGTDYMDLVSRLPSVPVLRKPIDKDTLIAAVDELLAEGGLID
jgi:DNA-binding response OmpR family regulator